MKRFAFLLPLALLFLVPFSAWAQEMPEDLPIPQIVAIAGDFQSELGCSGDWNTDCDNTYLALDSGSLVWRGTFEIPAGS